MQALSHHMMQVPAQHQEVAPADPDSDFEEPAPSVPQMSSAAQHVAAERCYVRLSCQPSSLWKEAVSLLVCHAAQQGQAAGSPCSRGLDCCAADLARGRAEGTPTVPAGTAAWGDARARPLRPQVTCSGQLCPALKACCGERLPWHKGLLAGAHTPGLQSPGHPCIWGLLRGRASTAS